VTETNLLVARHTVLSVVVGSRAFGLATETSDTDRRGVYALPAAMYFGLTKPATHHEGPLPEQFRWEVERFVGLALSANPNVLEALHSPLIEEITPLGEELRALAPAFLSRRIADTYLRYAAAQFTKAQRGVDRAGQPVWRARHTPAAFADRRCRPGRERRTHPRRRRASRRPTVRQGRPSAMG
jgi:hypothetical protein